MKSVLCSVIYAYKKAVVIKYTHIIYIYIYIIYIYVCVCVYLITTAFDHITKVFLGAISKPQYMTLHKTDLMY